MFYAILLYSDEGYVTVVNYSSLEIAFVSPEMADRYPISESDKTMKSILKKFPDLKKAVVTLAISDIQKTGE